MWAEENPHGILDRFQYQFSLDAWVGDWLIGISTRKTYRQVVSQLFGTNTTTVFGGCAIGNKKCNVVYARWGVPACFLAAREFLTVTCGER